MPKLILFAATLFSGPSRQRGGTAAQAHAQTIRSRVASRRLRAFDPHAPWVDRGPLDLSRRH